MTCHIDSVLPSAWETDDVNNKPHHKLVFLTDTVNMAKRSDHLRRSEFRNESLLFVSLNERDEIIVSELTS